MTCELAESRAEEMTEDILKGGAMEERDNILESLRNQVQQLYDGIKSEKLDATITEQMEIRFLTAELQRTRNTT